MAVDHRPGIKALSPQLRNKLRDDCSKVAAARRQATLNKYRMSLSPIQLQSKVQEEVREAVKLEMGRQLQLVDNGGAGASAMHAGGSGTAPGPGTSGGGVAGADGAEVDAFLRDLEEDIMADVALELDRIQADEEAAVAAAVGRMEAHMLAESRGGAGGVLCPVCQSAHLVQTLGYIACPAERWQLAIAGEGLSLDDLQRRLAAVYGEHGTGGCPGRLAFALQQQFGPACMVARCEQCGLHEIVL